LKISEGISIYVPSSKAFQEAGRRMLEDDKHSLGNQISWVLCQVVKLTAHSS
jgi:hypothetical protein